MTQEMIYRARGHRRGNLFYSTEACGPEADTPEQAWDDAYDYGIVPSYIEEAVAPTWTRSDWTIADD